MRSPGSLIIGNYGNLIKTQHVNWMKTDFKELEVKMKAHKNQKSRLELKQKVIEEQSSRKKSDFIANQIKQINGLRIEKDLLDNGVFQFTIYDGNHDKTLLIIEGDVTWGKVVKICVLRENISAHTIPNLITNKNYQFVIIDGNEKIISQGVTYICS